MIKEVAYANKNMILSLSDKLESLETRFQAWETTYLAEVLDRLPMQQRSEEEVDDDDVDTVRQSLHYPAL